LEFRVSPAANEETRAGKAEGNQGTVESTQIHIHSRDGAMAPFSGCQSTRLHGPDQRFTDRIGRGFVCQLDKVFRGDARKQGELHRWMYDKYTLTALLSNCGFKELKVVTAQSSRIEGWTRFDLDTNEDGTIYKPGSLYLEGLKV